MATRNGSYQNHARIEWVYTVGSVGPNTTSVSVQVTAYLRMQSGYSINGTWPVNWWGSWGTSSNTQNMVLGGGQRKQIRSWSQTVTLTSSSQSRSVAIRAQHYWGSTQDTLTFSIPARQTSTPPGTPTNPQINLLSDDLIRVAWTRQGTYTSVGVQRQTDTGSWSGRGAAQGNAGDWTDSWVDLDRRYRYRFQGRNSGGSSNWSTPTEYIYTRPGRVGGVSAERLGGGILVSATNLRAWATHYDIESDQDGIVGSSIPRSGMPWLHSNPSTAAPHRYRVRARVNSGGNDASVLVGAWSSWSNTVQVIQPPNAPTNLSPNGGVVDLAEPVTFSWRHNPADSSAQSSAELRYRETGTTSWTTKTITGSTQQTVESLSSIGAGTVEWQVRTKGAHADFSPWSALASLTLIDAPGVAILQPESIHRSITLTVQWNYSQAQARPQSSWQVQLTDANSGALIESRSGSGSLSSLSLNARLDADTNYIVRVRVATGSVWSDWAEMLFVTEFVPPREPIIEGEWNEETGSYDLTIEDADCTDDGILYQNLAPNPRMQTVTGSMVEVRRNLSTNPSFETDLSATLTSFGSSYLTREQRETRFGSWVAATDYDWGAFSYIYQRYDVSPVADDWWLAFKVHHLESDGTPTAVRIAYRAGTDGEWAYTSFSEIAHRPLGDPGTAQVAVLVPAATTEYRVMVYGSAGEAQTESRVMYTDAWSVGRGASEAAALAQVQDFFDGDTLPADVNPDDLAVRWLGDAGNSESVLEGQRVASLGSASTSWTLHPYQVDDGAGGKAARFAVVTSGASRVPISDYGGQLTPGASHTMKFRVRSSDALTNLSPRIQNQTGAPLVSIPANEWVDIQVTQPAGTSTWSNTGFYLNSGSGQQPGTLIDIANAMLVPVAAGEEYTGPYHDGDDLGWGWTGTPHNSVSTELERPASVSVLVERSIDDGATWEQITEAAFEDCTLSLSDFEGLSYGTTLYRVTNSAATGASIDVVQEGLADSQAIWLGTGEGFVQTARIPIHEGVGISRGRERSLEQYQGRSLGVAYMSANLSRTVSVQGMVPDTDMLDCPSVTRDELERIIVWPYPTHLHRDMHGNRVYGIAGNIGLDREWIMAHRDCGEHQGLCGLGLWVFRYDIDETESR